MHPLPKLGLLLTVDAFKPHVGEMFLADATPEAIGVKLDEVHAGPSIDWLPREPFSLVFSTPWDTMLVEGAYRLKTPRGDMIELYLIPTQTMSGPRRYYHSIFN